MRSIVRFLFETELPTKIDAVMARHLKLFHALIFPILIAAGLFGFFSIANTDVTTLKSYWIELSNNGWFVVYFALLGLALTIRLTVTVLSYGWHEKTFGRPISPRYIVFMQASFWVFQIAFALSAIGIVMFSVGAIEFIAALMDYDIVWSARSLEAFLQAVISAVPTLVSLPYLLAFLLVYLVTSFFEYWQHRLPHESRFLWLLAHRPHHTSTVLTDVTVMEADPAFPFGFLNRLGFAFLAGMSAKLVHTDPMVYEFLALALLKNMTEVFNHSSVFYERIIKLWDKHILIKWFFMLPGTGPYHYLHHTSKKGDEVVNIGGGPFMLWDRLFGTFKEPPRQKPRIGLTDQPAIYLNPLTHVFAGLLQLAFELCHNKSFKVRVKILFGSAYYTPPISRDFLKKPADLQPAGASLPHILLEPDHSI